MADKLSVYNGALRLLGERTLASLTENREPRRLLDSVWYNNEAMKFCLEAGLWNFAMRAVQLPYTPSVTPAFGYTYAFEKPEDFVRTASFCSDEFFREAILDYLDLPSYWYANSDTVYVKYVSADTDTGFDMSLWPPSFTKFVESYVANEIAPTLVQDAAKKELLERELKDALRVAKSRDAMEEATKPRVFDSAWSSARTRSMFSTKRFTGGIY